ncbi:MAG: hypothetical protein ACE5J3_01280 [Methanosarcinales archaeon]
MKKYNSLEWIHKVREEIYEENKNKEWEKIVEQTKIKTDPIIKKLGLKVLKPTIQ